MVVHCLLVAVLLFSAIPPSSRQQHAGVGRNRVTIVERLRSELLEVLDSEADADDDVLVAAERVAPHLTRSPTLRRGSSYWFLWLLTGIDIRPTRTPNVPTLSSLRIQP